jgi:ferric-dicitrate binding protein FerR (iron transport regulator)
VDQKQYLRTLYPKLIDQTISDEELSWLQHYFERSDLDDLYAMIRAELQLSDDELLPEPSALEIASGVRVYHRLEGEIAKEMVPIRKIRLWPRIAAAASIVLAIGAGIFFYTNPSKKDVVQTAGYSKDVAPGTVGATLTLADGKKIRLTDAGNGELAKESGVVVTKSADGQLVYTVQGDVAVDLATSGENVHKIRNVLSTERGETYMVVLPDQSKVWLNAASSLIYNTNMNISKERVVSLEGEAYFEVAKDKARPFVVISKGQEVEVLGTHFNVNGYEDEMTTATTLLEGSVKVSAGDVKQILKPGQQAKSVGNTINVSQADVETVMDWKNGDFFLNRVDFRTAMRKIARWYNVEVIYDKSVPTDIESSGYISRTNNLSAVLKLIEKSGQVHFRIEDRRIFVSK